MTRHNDYRRIDSLSDILARMARKKGWSKKFSRVQIWSLWEEIAGPSVSVHAWPLRFMEGDTLIIVVSDSVWMHQLYMQKTVLIKRFNDLLPEESQIKDIKFRLGDIERTRASFILKERDEKGKKEGHLASCSEDDLAKADELFKSMEDQELRESFKRLYLKSCSRKKK